MSNLIVKTAFTSRLSTWAASLSPALPVAYENNPFIPPTTAYGACYLLTADTVSYTLDQTHRQLKGLFQINLFEEVGRGMGRLFDWAASLETLFPCATPLTQSGLKIYITQPMSLGSSVQDGSHLMLPVSFQYQVDYFV